MKHIILLLLLTFNLSIYSQVKVALTGGINFNSTNFKRTGNSLPDTADYNFTSTGRKQGFNVGVLVNIGVTQNWYIETGLSYIKKGGTTKDQTSLIGIGGGIPYESSTYFTPSYIQLPIYLLYLPEAKKKYKLSGGAGMYIGRGIGGQYYKNSRISNGNAYVSERDIKYGTNASADFSPIELGVGARVGFLIMDNLEFVVNYQHSILNNIPKANQNNGKALFSTTGISIIKYIKK